MPDDSLEALTAQVQTSRRAFIRKSALAAISAPVAVGALGAWVAGAEQAPEQKGQDHSGGSMSPHPAPISGATKAEEMDRLHEAVIKAFHAESEHGMFGMVTALIVEK